MRRRTVVVCVAAALSAACGHDEQRAQPPASSVAAPRVSGVAPALPASAPAVASASAAPPAARQHVETAVGKASGPVVKLLDAGAAPRRRLRYAFKTGQLDRVHVTSSTGLELAVAGKQMPSPSMPDVAMLGAVRVLSVAPDGGAERELTIENLELVMPPGSPPLPDALAKSLAKVRGMTARDRVRPDGMVTSMELDTSHLDDPQLQQLLASLQGALGQMSAPFPEEEVGIGARWNVSTNVTQQGMPFEQVATYKLDALDGDRGATRIEIVQHAREGHVVLPGVPPGVDTTLLGMTSKGGGRVEFDLVRGAPRGRIGVETTVDVRVSAEGQTNDTHMVMKLDTHFEPAPAKSAKK